MSMQHRMVSHYHDISICARCGDFADGRRVLLDREGRPLSFCGPCAIKLGRAWLKSRPGPCEGS